MANINEIIPKSAIDGIVKANEAVTTVDNSTLKFITTIDKLIKELNKSGITFKEVSAATKKVATERKKLTQLEKDALVAEKALETARKRDLRLTATMNAGLNKEIKTRKDLKQKLRALEIQTDRLVIGNKKDEAQRKKNIATMKRYNTMLGKGEQASGRFGRNVGNYTGALKGAASSLMGALGVTAGIAGMVQVLRGAIDTVKTFEKALSSLSAITGATGKDLTFYADTAKGFSLTMSLSAEEIVKAFELVGSIRPELLSSKEALAAVTQQAIILSEATGGQLGVAEAAKTAAGAMNQFGLSTGDAAKTVDILVAAQTYGSATAGQLAETFKNFGTVAADSNLTLQQGAALAEVLAEKMIVESEAGTKLTSTLINLKNAGVGYASGQFDVGDALAEVRKKVDGLTTAYEKDMLMIEIFGKRNITVGTILLNNIDRYEELTELVDENGIALKKAKTQADNLAGSMTLLGNAWDNIILSFSGSTGAMKKVTDFLSTSFNYFARIRQLKGGDISGFIATLELPPSTITTYEEADEALTKYMNRMNELINIPVGQRTKEQEKEFGRLEKRIDSLTEKLKTLKKAEPEPETGGGGGTGKASALLKDEWEGLGDEEELIWEGKNEAKKESEKGYTDFYREEVEERMDIFTENLKEQEDLLEQKKEDDLAREQQMTEAVQELLISSVEAASDIYGAYLQRDLDQLQEKQDYELSLVEGNRSKEDEINKKYDKKKADIRKKQAQADKAAAIITATINTALAIVSAYATPPAPVGLALGFVMGALGAIQIAAILAQPIPQFYKGTESAPGGLLSVGEKGRELIETRSGKVLMANSPTLTSGLEGARIYSNPETERLINAGKIGYDSPDIRGTLERNNERLIKAIKDKRELHIDASKRTITERKGNYYKTYFNAKLHG